MNNMSFEEFKREVVERILEYLPDSFKGADVSLNVVTKANDVRLTGLTILRSGCNMAPTIYLEKFFEMYEGGDNIGVILRRIADVRVANDASDIVSVSEILDFEFCKERILPRLYGAELNKAVMEERPYTLIGDFAVFYIVCIDETEDGIMSIPINNQMIKSWGVNIDEIHDIAVNNLSKANDGTFKKMSEVMKELMLPQMIAEMGGDEEMAEKLFDDMFGAESNPMYILSNTKNVNGATILLDKTYMNNIVDKLGTDFYILPSSIHEVLIVPANVMSPDELASMVYEINRAQVQEEERLSDHVYMYSKETGYTRAA